MSRQASDFATLKGAQIATSAFLFSFSFSGGNIRVQRGLLPELDFCLAIREIFDSKEECVVLLYKGGKRDLQMSQPRLQTTQLPPGRLRRGQQLACKELGPFRGATAGSMLWALSTRVETLQALLNHISE